MNKKPIFITRGITQEKSTDTKFIVESFGRVFKMNFTSVEAKDLHPFDVIINESGEVFEIDAIEINEGIYKVYMTSDTHEELSEDFTSDTTMGLVNNFKDIDCVEYDEVLELHEDTNKKVKLNKIMQGDVKKYKVYVKNDKGNVVKVNFGDPNMEIKRDNPERRKNFRARHNCDTPGPRWKAKYWACKTWSNKSVTALLKENVEKPKSDIRKKVEKLVVDETLNSLNEIVYNPNLYGRLTKFN